MAEEEAQHPFDLVQGPVFRGTLLQLGDTDYLLLLTVHHIASDGWSMEVLYKELATIYEAFTAGRPSPLPELPVQYADFALWQRDQLQGEVLAEQLAYWKKQLVGASVLQLPTDYPRPAVQTYKGATRRLKLPWELTEGLRSLGRREGATLFMTLMAAFQTLLYRYTGQEDICVGTPVAGRNQAEIEGLIGFFVNTLTIRTNSVVIRLSGNCWDVSGKSPWGPIHTKTFPLSNWWMNCSLSVH